MTKGLGRQALHLQLASWQPDAVPDALPHAVLHTKWISTTPMLAIGVANMLSTLPANKVV